MMGIVLDLDREKDLAQIAKALSSETRIDILRQLSAAERNVNEIAELLSLPQSSAVTHIKILEEAGLIRCVLQPGIRGSMKVCSIAVEDIGIRLKSGDKEISRVKIMEMPVGHFVDYYAEPTCGIAGEKGPVGEEDEPRCFFHPDRIGAQLIWLGRGYLEYRFPNDFLEDLHVKRLEISAEMCSEDHEYNPDYPSDITLWVNGREAGTWTCPGDFGGRRGRLNPEWWPDKNTQYGILKTWKLTADGTYIDEEKVSAACLSDYDLTENPYISVRIGIKEDADHAGGLNLFGKQFGDYGQDLVMKFIL